jgi:ABC-type multidrug transport system fused ATPase/permease subunit
VTLVSWTLSFLRPYRRRTLAIAILSIVEIGLAALAPWPLKVMVDNVLGDTPLAPFLAGLLPGQLGSSAATLLVVVVVAGVLVQLGSGSSTRYVRVCCPTCRRCRCAITSSPGPPTPSTASTPTPTVSTTWSSAGCSR